MAARRHQHAPAPTPHPHHLERHTLTLADGATTTVHVARHDGARVQLRIAVLPRPMPLAQWCAQAGVSEALVGGFYVRPHGMPLGELRTGGVARRSASFDAPWGARRACVHVAGGRVRIARRDDIASEPPGDLLQAGPLLVSDGFAVGGDDEGFSAGAGQFDSDITAGRYPRAALGVCGDGSLLAVAVDGRSDVDCGLTIAELASALVDFGAVAAINLDGGGSTTLVCDGRLANVPREVHGIEIAGGRAVSTALVFSER
jgi:Phosphodiester glycosidase